MQVFKSIHVVLVVVAVFGTARAEGEGIQCPVLPVAGGEKAAGFTEFKNMVLECIVPDRSIKETLEGINTTEEFRAVLKGYCDKTSTYVECITSSKQLANSCLQDPIEVGKIEVEANIIQHVLQIACEQDGARLVSIIMESSARPESANRFVDTCIKSAIKNMDFNSATISQYSLQHYQVLTSFKTCVVNAVKGNDAGLEDAIALLNQALDTMSCIDDDPENNGLCKTIVEAECRDHIEDYAPTLKKPYEIFGGEAAECYLQGENQSRIRTQMKQAHTVQEYQTVFKDICDLELSAKRCLVENKLFAELCLQGKHVDIYRVMMDRLEVVYHTSCEDEGVRLSNILAAFRATPEPFSNENGTCFSFAEEGLKSEVYEHENFRLFQYRLMKNFVNCITEIGRNNNNQGILDAATFVDEGVEKLTCLGGENGDIVLCNTLTEIPH